MFSFFTWLLFAVATVPLATTFVPTTLALYAPPTLVWQFAEQKPHVRAALASVATIVAYPAVAVLNWTFSWLFSPLLFTALVVFSLVVNVNTRAFAQRLLKTYGGGIDTTALADWADYVASLYDARVARIVGDKNRPLSIASEAKETVIVDDHDENKESSVVKKE